MRNGPKQPMIESDGLRVSKCENPYNQCDLKLISKNYKAINLLYFSMNGDEFERTTSCTSTREIWNKLIVTYEGTSQVKENKIIFFIL